MPLNYSKWDKLELSDDSDIEGHPNVDHKSLVRWKQRDIHEKRAIRNQKILDLRAEIACNDVLLPRLRTITEEVHGAPDGPAQFSKIVEQLKTNPSPDAPDTEAPKKITYDEMVLALLMQVYDDARQKGVDKNDDRLREVLIANLKGHIVKLGEHQDKLKKDLENEEAEKARKITSEGIHEGFESHYVPPPAEPAPVKGAKTKKSQQTSIEVLNAKAVEEAQAAELASRPSEPLTKDPSEPEPEDAVEDELPEMTPNLEAFSKLPLRGYEKSFKFIQQHRDVYVPGAADALLIRAFTSEGDGESKYAKQCVHQSLLIQYCEKLGKDGVGIFFKRMMSGDPRVEQVFLKDVEDTYNHLKTRVKATADDESAQGMEQIQLVAENPNQQITFNVPDGPPPENLQLEGPGMESVTIEEVRSALQTRWEVFSAFPEPMKEALKAQSLAEVNKALGSMKIEEAEKVVELLDNVGILSFVEGGIRDETGQHKDGEEEGEA